MSEKFKYKYVAPTLEERKEIESIRRTYLQQEEAMTKLDRLRYLDNLVKTLPMIWGISLGVIGLLSFGTGMLFFLEWTALWYSGFPFGLCGLILIILAYPIYLKKIKKNKAKYKEEILALSQELLVDNRE